MKYALDKWVVALCLATALQLHGQGLIYDQQSANAPLRNNFDSFDLYKQQLWESFVPTLSSIGFVQLQIWDYLDTDTSGARLGVAVFSGSPSDPTLLGTSEMVYLPPNFNNDQLVFTGVTNFCFATPITLTPGQTYYFSPLEITGDHSWAVVVTDNTYANGGLYGFNGTDLWFREGIVVPEPSDLELLAMGGLLLTGILGFKGKQTTTRYEEYFS